MRTYSSAHWKASQEAWASGEFSDEWTPFRAAAVERGILYPPDGTKWDSWEDDPPSQRAILIREIRDRPEGLLGIIERSRSWSEVVAACISGLARLREEVGDGELVEQETAWRKRADRRADAESLGDIIRRVSEREARP